MRCMWAVGMCVVCCMYVVGLRGVMYIVGVCGGVMGCNICACGVCACDGCGVFGIGVCVI